MTDLILRKAAELKNSCRLLEYYRVLNLNEDKSEEILQELLTYQNDDGGFGNALEPDFRLPKSSAMATAKAISILEEIHTSKKEKTIKEIINYLETSMLEDYSFDIVPQEVNNFPRAIWWNYEQRDQFTFGNPNPELYGFLINYKNYVSSLDIQQLKHKMIDYILDVEKEDVSMNSIYSMLRFYNRVDDNVKFMITPKLKLLIKNKIELDPDLWDDYVLEPYKIYVITPKFAFDYNDLLNQNMKKVTNTLLTSTIKPNWSWMQYDEVFNQIKPEWEGILTFEGLKALKKYSSRFHSF
ncbi:MAG: hypothetical protein K9L74_04060 [Candidatus Izimaplasma sp.]|nr:hypothetical protein [Candidatus Izimaplasma bacterium]